MFKKKSVWLQFGKWFGGGGRVGEQKKVRRFLKQFKVSKMAAVDEGAALEVESAMLGQ